MSTDAELVERYLEHVRVGKRLAQRTVELYALDLQKLAACAGSGPRMEETIGSSAPARDSLRRAARRGSGSRISEQAPVIPVS